MSAVVAVLGALLLLALVTPRVRRRRSSPGEWERRFREAQEARRLTQQPWDVPERRGDR